MCEVNMSERDSREKLEADVRDYFSHWIGGTSRTQEAIKSWLDRQAAITEREWKEQCAADECCGFQELVDINTQAQAKVDELTEERDRLRGQLDDFDGDCYCGATVTEWYELAARLQDEVDELAEERDRLRNQVELKDDIIEGLRQSLDETIDERNGLAAQVEAKEQLERDSAYMRLPVDADGVPIRIGDEMEWTNSHNGEKERFVCAGYTTEYSTWTPDNRALMATNEESAEFYCDQCRHVQPDTVESLLDEFMVALHELGEGADYGPTKERMAERIRKAVEHG